MDAKKLLEEIYISKELKDCIAKIKPIDIQQDVLQHSFVELLLKDDDLIIDLAKRNKLLPFVTKVIYNMVKWQRSTWKYTKSKEIYNGINYDNNVVEENEEEINIPLESLYWYEARILELYAEHGSYRKVEQITGISYVSIFNTVKKARKNIKKNMDL